MAVLECQTPARVRTHLWMHLLGYNLVRCQMAQVASGHDLTPRQLSFGAAARLLDEWGWRLLAQEEGAEAQLGARLAEALLPHRVGNRPGRVEPREVKHRQRKYKELRKGRQRRQELLDG